MGWGLLGVGMHHHSSTQEQAEAAASLGWAGGGIEGGCIAVWSEEGSKSERRHVEMTPRPLQSITSRQGEQERRRR